MAVRSPAMGRLRRISMAMLLQCDSALLDGSESKNDRVRKEALEQNRAGSQPGQELEPAGEWAVGLAVARAAQAWEKRVGRRWPGWCVCPGQGQGLVQG